MKKLKRFLLLMTMASLAQAAEVGKPAPDFSATDTHGQTHQFSDYKDKFVVLEWHNKDCPFTRAHYRKGKMQDLQAKWTAKGVIWLRVISSAPGKQGYVTGPQAEESAKEQKAKATATFLDPDGIMGHAYGAKTSPHMFVINPQGILIYNGAIDNAPLEDNVIRKTGDGSPYVNYVDRALQEAMVEKRKVAVPSMSPYGCSVKYK